MELTFKLKIKDQEIELNENEMLELRILIDKNLKKIPSLMEMLSEDLDKMQQDFIARFNMETTYRTSED